MIPSALIGAGLALLVVGGAWLGGAMSAPSAVAPVQTASAAATGTPLAETADPARAQVQAPLEPRPGASPSARPTAAPVASPASAPAASAPSAESSAAAVAGAAPAGGGDLPAPGAGAVTEVELVQRAQHALPHDPAQALAAAEEHRRRFAGGALAQEREVIAISALVGMGHRDEARARAARFLSSYPGSVHRHGVEALVPGIASGGLDHKNDADRGPTP